MKRTFGALVVLLLSAVCLVVVACATQGDTSTDGYAQLDESKADVDADNQATGGGPQDDASQRMSNLDGDRRLDQLSEGQQEAMCSQMADYFGTHLPPEDMEEWSCTMAGITMAQFGQLEDDQQLRAACASARDECLMAEDDDTDDEEFECNIPPQCDATVAEWEGCLVAIVGQFELMMDSTPACEELTIDGLEEALTFDEVDRQPQACEVMEEKCPNLLSSE